ncbi:putative Tetrahydromethanopterin-linked C1 transfer pathway [Rhodopirellula islandica]|uniref:Tetrahydromethanopterin-linked C1 transfer pathway n=1 Tax=Rhodopirellula islandica TaxID=595434 RepID=A0A0J1BI94_RHOIS|nr:hydantoinase/oxoprolinase family protein [Rhodopirellula islandica]KLU06286.1 putative Tetrahydromethanopterin-linked C1 transfer pathway [Rhodopirellula islandica]
MDEPLTATPTSPAPDPPPPFILGVDVGGANLKSVLVNHATEDATARESFFPMWKRPESLAEQLHSDWIALLAESRVKVDLIQGIAVTMTGELADCFTDRQHGVTHIAEQVRIAATQLSHDSELGFYSTAGKFVGIEAVASEVDALAASNWHALASWAASQISARGILIDVGSTTTDLIPIQNGQVATAAKTDHERLRDGSLVYVGCRRTPVCALVDRLTIDQVDVPVMNELFATIDDARLILKRLPESADDRDSADGRPRDRQSAHRRLAKMVGLDANELTSDQASSIAKQILAAAQQQIDESLQRQIERLDSHSNEETTLLLSGHGQDLITHSATARNAIDLRDRLSPEVSRSAPAFAVARLWLSTQREVR